MTTTKTLYKRSILRALFLLLTLFSLSACEHGAGPFAPLSPISLPPFPPLPDFDIAIWNTGQRQGDFGFSLCQDLLESTGGTSDAERIGEWLREGGYTRAVFFGSTNEYNFRATHTDPDGLVGPGGDPAAIADLNVGLVTIDSSGDFNYQSEFAGNTIPLNELFGSRLLVIPDPQAGRRPLNNFSVDDLLIVAGLIVALTPDNFWTFTDGSARFNRADNCNNATALTNGSFGNLFFHTLLSTNRVNIGGGFFANCNRMLHVLCIARR